MVCECEMTSITCVGGKSMISRADSWSSSKIETVMEASEKYKYTANLLKELQFDIVYVTIVIISAMPC